MIIIPPKHHSSVLNEIKMGLPSKRIYIFAHTLSICNPLTNDIFLLKWRFTEEDLSESIKEGNFINISDRRSWDAEWIDLLYQNVIINPSILNNSGRKAFESLINLHAEARNEYSLHQESI